MFYNSVVCRNIAALFNASALFNTFNRILVWMDYKIQFSRPGNIRENVKVGWVYLSTLSKGCDCNCNFDWESTGFDAKVFFLLISLPRTNDILSQNVFTNSPTTLASQDWRYMRQCSFVFLSTRSGHSMGLVRVLITPIIWRFGNICIYSLFDPVNPLALKTLTQGMVSSRKVQRMSEWNPKVSLLIGKYRITYFQKN